MQQITISKTKGSYHELFGLDEERKDFVDTIFASCMKELEKQNPDVSMIEMRATDFHYKVLTEFTSNVHGLLNDQEMAYAFYKLGITMERFTETINKKSDLIEQLMKKSIVYTNSFYLEN